MSGSDEDNTMGSNPQRNSFYYFSQHLREILAGIPSYGLTVIEAPSGFGKTTALREYLTREQKTARVRWYTCFGESADRTWRGICALFGGSEDSIADEMLELGTPSLENLADIASLISGYTCAEPTFVVIDNYQLFDCPVRKRCISAFSACSDENIHLILVTQPLKDEGETFHAQPYLSITSRDLFFDNQCLSNTAA